MSPTKMKALRFERYCPPGAVLSIQDLPLPALEDAEVFVQIKASSINPSDVGTAGNFLSKLPIHCEIARQIANIRTAFFSRR